MGEVRNTAARDKPKDHGVEIEYSSPRAKRQGKRAKTTWLHLLKKLDLTGKHDLWIKVHSRDIQLLHWGVL